MSTTTPNLSLIKPADNDTLSASIGMFRSSFDIIDSAVAARATSANPTFISGSQVLPTIRGQRILGQTADLINLKDENNTTLLRADNTGLLYHPNGSVLLDTTTANAAYVPQPATPTALYVIRRNAANTGFEYASPTGNNPGEIAHPNSLNATALASTAGILYVRVRPAAAITVTALRVLWSSTAGTGDVGIYSSSGSGSSAVPNTKLVSASATSPGLLGWADVTVTSTALAAGTDYWLAVGNGNANVFECNNNSVPEAAALRGQANGALPGTAAPTTSPATWPMIKIMG